MNKIYSLKAARIISTLFIPPLLTLITFIYLALQFEISPTKEFCVITIAAIFGFVLQILSFLYFYKKAYLSDIDVKMKSERTIPYWFSLFLFIAGIIILLLCNVSSVSIAFWFCYISNTFLIILINSKSKISIHAMGVTGPAGLFFYLNNNLTFILLPILLIVGWSRWKLKVHAINEIIFGALLGFVSVYFQLLLFLG